MCDRGICVGIDMWFIISICIAINSVVHLSYIYVLYMYMMYKLHLMSDQNLRMAEQNLLCSDKI